MKNIIPADLSKLTFDELERLTWEITEETYQITKPLREEIWKRIQKKKQEQENLKKAS